MERKGSLQKADRVQMDSGRNDPAKAGVQKVRTRRASELAHTELPMSTHFQTVLNLLHSTLDLTGLKGKEITEAKRECVVENGGTKAIEAAAKLVEQGIPANWLCPDNHLAVDSLNAVEKLVASGAIVEKMLQFTPSQILVGLDEAQLVSVMPQVVEVEAAPAVEIETVVEQKPVVVAKPAAPKAKVEAKKPVELFKCSYTSDRSKQKYSADQLVVPNGVIIREILKLKPDAVLTREQIIGQARLPDFVGKQQRQNFFFLSDALALLAKAEHIAKKQAEQDKIQAAKDQKKQDELNAYFAFCKTVHFGKTEEWKGVLRRKCNCCNHVFVANLARFPELGYLQFSTPKRGRDGSALKDREGNALTTTPTVDATLNRFTTCPKCVPVLTEKHKIGAWLDEEMMTTIVSAQVATEMATEAAEQRKRAQQQQAKGYQGNGRQQFDMSVRDNSAGRELLVDGVYVDDGKPNKGGKPNKRSRGDERRASSDYASEAAEG